MDVGAQAELSLGGMSAGFGQASGEGEDVIARLDLKYALSQLAIFRPAVSWLKMAKNLETGRSVLHGLLLC